MSMITIILDGIFLTVWYLVYYSATPVEHIFRCDTIYYLAHFLSVTQSFNKSLITVYGLSV
jgi:hypothetical protein